MRVCAQSPDARAARARRVSLLAKGVATLVHPICYEVVSLSSLIALLQGFPMTNAVVELATRNPISGTARLFTGIVITAMTGFGLDVGSTLAEILGLRGRSDQTASGACEYPVSPVFYLLVFLPMTLSFSVLINAHVSQMPSMTVIAALAFATNFFLSLSPTLKHLNSFLSAIVVGCAGNLYADMSGKPALMGTTSGVFMLVPGAMALRSVRAILGDDVAVGLQLTAEVMIVAISIGAGLFMSSLIVVPKEVFHVTRRSFKNQFVMQKGGYTRQRSMAPLYF